MKAEKIISLLLFCLINLSMVGQETTVKIGLLKYSGGGDWYANPTSLPNLIDFCNKQINTQIQVDPEIIEVGSRDLFTVAMVHMTGHGNVVFSDQEVNNMRKYLEAGGFLHIDDNYGLDPFIRREMKKVFPDQDFEEIPWDHPIFQKPYQFTSGLPKVHEHDNKRPQAFALFHKGRMVCFYSYESDLGDGWEDRAVHSDSEETRLQALKMGANLVNYVFTQ